MLIYLAFIAGWVVLDQITKAMAVAALGDGAQPVLPFLDFSLAYNTGAAFSILGQAGGWQRYFFIIVGIVVTVILFVMMRNAVAKTPQVAAACAFIIGGAVGNLIDRVLLGYVVDFIHVFYGNWHFPTFNVADTAITLGVILLLGDSFGLKLWPGASTRSPS